MSKLRLVVLESDDADGHAIGAIVGVLREMQIGRLQPQVTSASIEQFSEALREQTPEPTPVLRAAKPRKAKSRASAPARAPSEGGRASNAGATIIAALRKSPRPDRAKLAMAIYGDAGKTAKVGQVIGYLTNRGKLKNNGDGTYAVVG